MEEEGLAIERIASYIQQLDQILDGGFPLGSKVLITGAPGTMKTTLAYSLLYNNAFADELFGGQPQNGIYITIEQDPLSILRHTHNMDMRLMDDARLRLVGVPWLKKKTKKIMNIHWETVEREVWFDALKRLMSEQVQKHRARLLVIDSLTAMMDRAEGLSQRDNLFEFFEWLGNLNTEGDGGEGAPVTTFLINEQTAKTFRSIPAASYVADGTLRLFSEEDAHIHRLYLQCDKMRMTNHDRDSYQMDFTEGKFVLNPVVLQKRG